MNQFEAAGDSNTLIVRAVNLSPPSDSRALSQIKTTLPDYMWNQDAVDHLEKQ
jgi:hypothetical protein